MSRDMLPGWEGERGNLARDYLLQLMIVYTVELTRGAGAWSECFISRDFL